MLEVDKNIKKDVSSNLSKIDANGTNIKNVSSAQGTINGLVSTNLSNITGNSSKIGNLENDILSNLTKIGDLEKYLTSSESFKKVYNIKKQTFEFNKDKHFLKLFEAEINNDFTIDSLLIIINYLYYKYNNLKNDYFRCQHEYNIYGDDKLIYTYIFNHDKYYNENSDNILFMNEDFCVRFENNYKKVKIVLDLHRHNRHGKGNIDLEIFNDSTDYINIDYLEKNNNKTYLKYLYNILFYDKKTQIDFSNIFYEKIFDVNANKNDFIEIDFKMSLEYEFINENAYIKSIYEIKDIENNSLYTKTIDHSTYTYFENKLFINENIFLILIKVLKK